jgi:hypothetical protein
LKANGCNHVPQTHSTRLKVINEFTEDAKNIRVRTVERFVIKRKLLVNHENGWRAHERLLMVALENCWLAVFFIIS